MELPDKDFNVATGNLFNELKETIFIKMRANYDDTI
jgi:hypothetical protein